MNTIRCKEAKIINIDIRPCKEARPVNMNNNINIKDTINGYDHNAKSIHINIKDLIELEKQKIYGNIWYINNITKRRTTIFAPVILSFIKENINIDINENSIITNLENKINILTEELNKKDELNKRLINTLMLYRYKEFDNTITYDYNEIKQKNKALNNEFKELQSL